jgi:hypothetical protein
MWCIATLPAAPSSLCSDVEACTSGIVGESRCGAASPPPFAPPDRSEKEQGGNGEHRTCLNFNTVKYKTQDIRKLINFCCRRVYSDARLRYLWRYETTQPPAKMKTPKLSEGNSPCATWTITAAFPKHESKQICSSESRHNKNVKAFRVALLHHTGFHLVENLAGRGKSAKY